MSDCEYDIEKRLSTPTRVTVTNGYGEYSICLPGSDMTVDGMVNDIFRPLLAAMGYFEESINDVLGESER